MIQLISIWSNPQAEETRKYTDESGENCMGLEIKATNQRGEVVMPSSAAVVLPSRDTRVSPIDSRLE